MNGDEAFENEVDFQAQKLNEDELNEEILNIIVENIFRKAQVEKEYCIFYGQLCEDLIHLEL